MPSTPFPEYPDADRLFTRNGTIDAELPQSRLRRLSDSLSDNSGQIDVVLRFDHDEQGRRRLTGSLRTTVQLDCQRCLRPMPVELHCELDLLVLDSEAEAAALPDADAVDTDVVVTEGENLDLLALIEDELLLSLPLVPLHDDEGCNALLNDLRQQAEDADSDAGRKGKPNPFAVLESLKQGSGTKGPDSNGNGTQ